MDPPRRHGRPDGGDGDGRLGSRRRVRVLLACAASLAFAAAQVGMFALGRGDARDDWVAHDDPDLPPARAIAKPPSRMHVRYADLWDHATGTIDVPDRHKNPFNVSRGGGARPPPTSLEILQEVLHGDAYRADFAAVESYVSGNFTGRVPNCLAPNLRATEELAKKVVAARSRKPERMLTRGKAWKESWPHEGLVLSLPILNVGFPKVGSNTLRDYLRCIGLCASHSQQGFRIVEISRKQKNIHAYAQLDNNAGRGEYPQISLLDELHEMWPNSTFVFNFRPVHDWIRSVNGWAGMMHRMSAFTVPGLVLTPAQLERNEEIHALKAKEMHRIEKGELLKRGRVGSGKYKALPLSMVQVAKWWCGHVNHIREFVREYPSHALIELDLYDANGTADLLYDLLQADVDAADGFSLTEQQKQNKQRCWGHSNKMSELNRTRKHLQRAEKRDKQCINPRHGDGS